MFTIQTVFELQWTIVRYLQEFEILDIGRDFFWERVRELAGTIDWCYNNPIANYNKFWDNNNCNKIISWKGQAAKIEEHNKNFHSFYLELR